MAFLNFLGGENPLQALMAGGMFPNGQQPRFGGGPNPDGSMSLGGGIAGMGSGLDSALAQNAAQPRQPQRPKLGIGDIVGLIADGVRGYRGQEPVYGPAMEARRLKETRKNALGNFLTDPQGAVQALLEGGDFEGGLELWKATHKDDDTPAGVREFEYYQKHPDQQPAMEKYWRLTHPGMMSPITMGAGDTIEMPGQDGGAPGGEITATGPGGEKIRFNPQSGQWEPVGGAPASPAPTFP